MPHELGYFEHVLWGHVSLSVMKYHRRNLFTHFCRILFWTFSCRVMEQMQVLWRSDSYNKYFSRESKLAVASISSSSWVGGRCSQQKLQNWLKDTYFIIDAFDTTKSFREMSGSITQHKWTTYKTCFVYEDVFFSVIHLCRRYFQEISVQGLNTLPVLR
jgi:hypothetical protein